MAVYTQLSFEDVGTFLNQYHVGDLISLKGIAEGIENTNYLLRTQHNGAESHYILTIYEQRVAPEELPFFLGLTEWLADRGISCPRPVRGKDGQRVYSLKGKAAALIQFLHGHGSPHITPTHLALTGAFIARMHQAAEDFPLTRSNSLALAGWRALFDRISGRADDIAPGLALELAVELEWLSTHWPQDLPSGIIHADLFPDNVFFIDGQTNRPELSGVIDFYFACHDFWSYDAVICMNAWCFSASHDFITARAHALWSAYDQERRLTAEEKNALPVLARGAAMRFVLTRAYDWLHQVEGALVNVKDPMEYVAKLRFHQAVNDYRAYGLE